MRVFANVSRVLTTTENVIAESKGGDATNVVMADARLDSVEAGTWRTTTAPGPARSSRRPSSCPKVKPKNKLRFAWWGAEEASLVGSTFYVAQLRRGGRGHRALPELDMIGSPNYGLFILDGDGDAFGTRGAGRLRRHRGALRAVPTRTQGEISAAKAFDGRSDYAPFTAAGIPAGGLFTGAEVPKTAEQVEWWGGEAGVPFNPATTRPATRSTTSTTTRWHSTPTRWRAVLVRIGT